VHAIFKISKSGRFMKSLIFSLSLAAFAHAQTKDQDIEKKIDDLLQRLTLEDKISLIAGTGFASREIAEYGIPEFKMADGPLGVRWDQSTAFPAGISLAASWDPKITERVGIAIGKETKAKGRDVILAPCVNIARLPMGGRNFESFGEDPFLASRMAVSYIKGVQSERVAATVKHFAVNNQEHERMTVDVQVSERALREIYFPAFKAAVQEAGVLCVMSAYNKVNGFYASENDFLLKDVLKEEWGFNGLVMSDWGAVHSDLPTFRGGLDLEMPDGKYLNNENLLTGLESGDLSVQTLDDKIRRLLRVMFHLDLLENPHTKDTAAVSTGEIRKTALDASLAGIVLLKNENNILPLNSARIKKLAVIGPNAANARTGGGGSSLVSPSYEISPLEALRKEFPDAEILYAQGVILDGDQNPVPSEYLSGKNGSGTGIRAEFFQNIELAGEPVLVREDRQINFQWHSGSPDERIENENYSIRWTGYLTPPVSGEYTLSVTSDDGIRLYIEGKNIIDDWNDHAMESRTAKAVFEAGKNYDFVLEYYERKGDAGCILQWQQPGIDLTQEAILAARDADAVLYFGGTSFNYESEGKDRDDLYLPEGQDDLITALSEVNKNTIVLLNIGSPVIMNQWINAVPGLIIGWFGGSETGSALSKVISGVYNPGGKLPVTFPVSYEDCSAYSTYKSQTDITSYSDDIFVGYRHFDAKDIRPLFNFGYGKSYTEFALSAPFPAKKVYAAGENILLKCKVKNTGSIAGSEVVQIYVSAPGKEISRCRKELKSFSKVFLQPGEEKEIVFEINTDELRYYDETKSAWKLEPGDYTIFAGNSSRKEDLKSTAIKITEK